MAILSSDLKALKSIHVPLVSLDLGPRMCFLTSPLGFCWNCVFVEKWTGVQAKSKCFTFMVVELVSVNPML